MSKYIACGLVIAVLASITSHDPMGEAIKSILTGVLAFYMMRMFNRYYQ